MEQSIQVDVLIIGAGVTGLTAALRLLQQADSHRQQLSVCLLEKSDEIGGHIISGAVMDTRALDELYPDWEKEISTWLTPCIQEMLHFMLTRRQVISLPDPVIPEVFLRRQCRLVSLSELCRWLAGKVIAAGGEILTGVSGSQLMFDHAGRVSGVITGDYGRESSGEPGPGFISGMRIQARQTLLAEGARGSLSRDAIGRFGLAATASQPQHYALGLKELWQINESLHCPGRVEHFTGWPLAPLRVNGGLFAYHMPNCQLALGMVADLDYSDMRFNPFETFQRARHHPRLAQLLAGGTRIAFGARALAKGGLKALPQMTFPGGMLLGCAAGTLNPQRMQGIHTAMKSALLAADVLYPWLQGHPNDDQLAQAFSNAFRGSWLWNELYEARDFPVAVRRFGTLCGTALWWISRFPLAHLWLSRLTPPLADHRHVSVSSFATKLPKFEPDGVLSFDRASSLYLSRIVSRSTQPCHLQCTNMTQQQGEMATHYCPGGVFVWQENESGRRLHINGQNCLHCKTCDIKDPQQTLRWCPPEGGSGPRYQDM
jgi:electron-transferring-flavoprotein dehydrogenase